MNLLAPVPWVRLVATALMAAGLVATGWYLGGLGPTAKYETERASHNADLAADATTLAAAATKRLKEETDYARQLLAAADQATVDRTELARVRATTRPGKLRCTADTGDSGTVPAVPAGTTDKAPGSGIIPAAVEFDPSAALYAEADRADDTIESCRLAISQWPK